MSETQHRARIMHTAPFFSRAYGGFSRAQTAFLAEYLEDLEGLRISDPMCGQAFEAASWAHAGAHVTASDINPGPLALASLRAPETIAHAQALAKTLNRLLDGMPAVRDVGSLTTSASWLPLFYADQLQAIGAHLRLTTRADVADAFASDRNARFVLGISALAARDIATYRLSDNLTWLKPGGVARVSALSGPLRRALESWLTWVKTVALVRPLGRLETRLESVHNTDSQRHDDLVITSPPYANRLDYSRLWAPELAVIEGICGTLFSECRTEQIGSNRAITPSARDLMDLSAAGRRVLREIRAGESWGSKNYYYPFFAAYAVGLMRATESVARMVRRGGRVVMFVRDTVRKDTLFPTAQIVRTTMERCGCFLVTGRHAVIRSHVGNMRSGRATGLLGRGQRESWLVFRKR